MDWQERITVDADRVAEERQRLPEAHPGIPGLQPVRLPGGAEAEAEPVPGLADEGAACIAARLRRERAECLGATTVTPSIRGEKPSPSTLTSGSARTTPAPSTAVKARDRDSTITTNHERTVVSDQSG